MKAQDVIANTYQVSAMVLRTYIGDFSDAELMHRPGVGCNHLAWQLGHLITSENQMVESVLPGTMPPLPAGFAEKYAKDTAACDDPKKFDDKATLLKVYREQRTASLKVLQTLSDQQLAQESPEAVRGYAPNVAAVFGLQGGHWLMHAGQWAVLRRQLGRSPLF